MSVIIKPNKNVILLYCMLSYMVNKKLITYKYLIKNNLQIRDKIINHFSKFDISFDYTLKYHRSKAIAFVLTLDNDLNKKDLKNISPEMKIEIEKGSEVLPLLNKFKKETDFNNFYNTTILPYLEKKNNILKNILIKSNLEKLLKKTWEISCNFDLNIIVNPLECRYCGIGPSLGKNSYQIMGPPFDKNIIFLLSHEGSHPYAKEYKRSSLKLIESKSHLFNKVKIQKNWPKQYYAWTTCFEEHLVRAMEIYCMDPYLEDKLDIKKVSIDKLLKKQKDKGFLYIDLFYEVIDKHKKNNTFKDSKKVIKDILELIENS